MPFLVLLALVTKEPPRPFAYGLCLIIGHNDGMLTTTPTAWGNHGYGFCSRCFKERSILG
jgi:hypothetical protein